MKAEKCFLIKSRFSLEPSTSLWRGCSEEKFNTTSISATFENYFPEKIFTVDVNMKRKFIFSWANFLIWICSSMLGNFSKTPLLPPRDFLKNNPVPWSWDSVSETSYINFLSVLSCSSILCKLIFLTYMVIYFFKRSNFIYSIFCVLLLSFIVSFTWL